MNNQVAATHDNLQYAGLKPRFLALVVDFVLLSLIFFPVTRIVMGVWVMTSEMHRWGYKWIVTDPLCLVFLAVIVVYFVLFEGVWGATPGKFLAGIRVVDTEGSRPGFRRSLVRNFLRAVDALPAFNILGVYLIATSNERARLGDRVAGTRVIMKSRG